MSSRVFNDEEQARLSISAFPYRQTRQPDGIPQGEDSPVDSGGTRQAIFEEGFAEGQRAALTKAESLLGPARLRLEKTIQDIEFLQPHLYRQAEQEVLKLACAIGSKIVRHEVQVDKDVVATMVRLCLEKVSRAASARIRLNPEDFRHLSSLQADGQDLGFGSGVALVEDESIEIGGCMVETEIGNADGRIDSQLREVSDTMLSAH